LKYHKTVTLGIDTRRLKAGWNAGYL